MNGPEEGIDVAEFVNRFHGSMRMTDLRKHHEQNRQSGPWNPYNNKYNPFHVMYHVQSDYARNRFNAQRTQTGRLKRGGPEPQNHYKLEEIKQHELDNMVRGLPNNAFVFNNTPPWAGKK